MRLATVDLDDAIGLEALWAELKRHRAIRDADPELREAIVRRCQRLPADMAAPVLAAFDEVHPNVVCEAYFTTLVPDMRTIGAVRRCRSRVDA
jgi:hypothetical protein